MKKILLGLFTLFLLNFGSADAAVIGKNLSFRDSVTNTTSTTAKTLTVNDQVYFKFVGVVTTTTSVPVTMTMSGTFTKGTYTYSGSCVFTTGSFQDNSLTFSFASTSASSCSLNLIFSYTPTSAGTNYQIAGVVNGTQTSPATLNMTVIDGIVLNKIYTKDYSTDGFLDGARLEFSSGFDISNFDFNQLSIENDGVYMSGFAYKSGSPSSGVYNYIDMVWNDGYLSGDALPNIHLTGFTSGGYTFQSVDNPTLVDQALPILYRLNNAVPGTSIIFDPTDTFIIRFSEPVQYSSLTGVSFRYIDNTILTGSFTPTSTTGTYTFTPNVSVIGNLTLGFSTGIVKDISNNAVAYQTYPLTLNDFAGPIGVNISGLGVGILINSGDATATTKIVNLQLSATDAVGGVYQMQISNDSGFSTGSGWLPYATNYTGWDLLANGGTGIVYVKFKDYSDNVGGSYYDMITYANPSNYVDVYASSNMYTSGTTLALTGGCDYVEGVETSLSYSVNTGANGTGTITCNTTTKTWSHTFTGLTLGQSNRVDISYTNIPSISNVFNIISDVTAPAGSSISGLGTGILINSGAGSTNTKTVNLQLLASDAGGVAYMEFSNKSNFTANSGWLPYATNYTGWDMLANGGTGIVYVKFRDNAGNVSTSYNDSITYNNTSNYVDVYSGANMYTSGTTLALTGGCDYVEGVETSLDYSVNTGANGAGTITCNTTTKTWSHTFTGLTLGQSNRVDISYTNIPSISNVFYIISDTTAPTITTNISLTGTYTSAQSLTISSNEAGSIYYSFTGFSNLVSYTGAISITGSKSIYIRGFDRAGNSTDLTGAMSFVCATSSVNNGTVASYPSCAVTCNAGFTWNGQTCVVTSTSSSGGGGGGGGGGFAGGFGDSGSSTTSTSGQGGGTTTTQGGTTVPEVSIQDIRNQISNISQGSLTIMLNKVVDTYAITDTGVNRKIGISNDLNNLENTYNKNLQDFVVNTAKYVETKDEKYRQAAQTSLQKMQIAKSELQAKIDDTIRIQDNVYHPVDPQLDAIFTKIQNIMVNKVRQLLDAEAITQSQYNEFMDAYNKFVYAVIIYKKEGSEQAREFAKTLLPTILKYYNMNLPEKKPETTQTQQPEQAKVYTRDLKVGISGADVNKVQQFLKAKGYWPAKTNITNYFGKVTLAQAQKYLKDKGVTAGAVITMDMLNKYFVE